MKIDIYTSASNGSKYLSVPVGTRVETLELPSSTDQCLKELSPFKTRLVLDFSKPHPTLNIDNIRTQIEDRGYAIHGASATVKTNILAD